eukprot:GHVP01024750.1.p1 GENE.GHVP01024750.1~~GHVP01024750.1.p1  ORF type:complete len:970 (+),score=210.15 GHVP01024750.1:736-3645(+)
MEPSQSIAPEKVVLQRQADEFKVLGSDLPAPIAVNTDMLDALSESSNKPAEHISFEKLIDPLLLKKEYEALRLNNRLSHIKELENDIEIDTDPIKLLKLRKLREVEHQANLRKIIIGMYKKINISDIPRREQNNQSILTELREKKNKTEKNKVISYEEYTEAIASHIEERFDRRKQQSIKLQKLSKLIIHTQQQRIKEEQRRSDKAERERLRALKADDEEEYRRLVSQEKNTRLEYLLKQTDDYLTGLVNKINALNRAEVKSEQSHILNSNTYYQAAHRVKEEIEQPKILEEGLYLKDYQLDGLTWLVSLYNNGLNGILADEMGLGKTIQTISLIAYLIEKKAQFGPFLLIFPLSTLSNWDGEFEKWAPSIKRIVYKPSGANKKDIQRRVQQDRYTVLLTTYECALRDHHFLGKIPWLYMIIDEGHRLKNKDSKLTTSLIRDYNSKFRLVLTGTPLQNNLRELWTLFNFVTHNLFNTTKTFEEWFNAPFANTGEIIELNEEEKLLIIKRLHKVLRPFLLRRLKKDVELNLPKKTETVIKCNMSGLQKYIYNIFCGTTNDEFGLFKGKRNIIMQLKKTCNHPFIFQEIEDVVNPSKTNNNLLYRVSGKINVLRNILHKLVSTNRKILIFFQMTQMMTIMEDFLLMEGLGYLRLDGSIVNEVRQERIAEFNNPESPKRIFILSTRAGGLGLNLQSADTVIIFDSDWNPHADLQAQDRAHRIGQQNEVRILRLVTKGSVEEYILEKAGNKLEMDDKIIQAGRFDQKTTNEERESILRSLLEKENEKKTTQEEEIVTTNTILNELISRSPEEKLIFEQIDKEKTNPGLFTEEELEEILMHREPKKQKVQDEGQRTRHSVADAWIIDMNTAISIIETCVSEDGRLCSELFYDVPSQKDYPDYYEHIAKPISLNMIREKVDKRKYRSLDEFENDILLMFQNAYSYNNESSTVYEDASSMEMAFSLFWEDIKDTEE